MKRKFIHKVLIKVGNIALHGFVIGLGMLAFTGIAGLIFGFLTGEIHIPEFNNLTGLSN